LNDRYEAARRRSESELRAVALVVRRALEKHRKLSVRSWPIDIRMENDTVAHFGARAALQYHFIGFGSLNQAGR